MTIHPESVGGTPAGRMIHKESNQLLIAHHLIGANGKIRTISPQDMPIRVTAIARHLTDPANMVYYIDMEGSIWEAEVHTLNVNRLFRKPVPGWHGKGGYTSQGRLVVANNGELHVGDYKDVLAGGAAGHKEERGVLAEFNGEKWKIVERRQFTEVTGPNGITGGSDGNDPIWTMGWDRRSVRLKVLDNGNWHTYLLPKAAFCNDASHGWYTEWPRIREITDGRWMMDMHGMFFDFPKTFSAANSSGLRPIGSHLRYVPDFCDWNGKLVLASDETSIQGNNLAGQPQSNLWFGSYEDLKHWGPANGYGGPWIEDRVSAGKPSDPFLVAGFDHRTLHLATGRNLAAASLRLRATDQQKITTMSEELARLPIVAVRRGDWHKPAPGYSFTVESPVTVYLAVDRRGNPKLSSEWKLTELTLTWGKEFSDRVYSRNFAAGEIKIPANATEHTSGSFGMPHAAFVAAMDSAPVTVKALGVAKVARIKQQADTVSSQSPVRFNIQIDRKGNGVWEEFDTVTLPAKGYVAHQLPDDLEATWLRITTDRDCTATAVLHQTTSRFADGEDSSNVDLFAGLAAAGVRDAQAAVLYAAKRNRNLRIITADDQHFEFSKTGFDFKSAEADSGLKKLLHIESEFSIDEASVILTHGGQKLRLPKGSADFNKPFASGWPRASREVQSERHLANIHGTFYEIPLVTNGAPPAWRQLRPVSSHNKQITDFCSWNGLLVLAGVRRGATNDGHVFAHPSAKTALWFGGIDDLWKLGKPVGHGGPWHDTLVKAAQPSDPYLMTGYDRKTLTLKADKDTTIRIEVDIDHQSGWHTYRSIPVPADRTVNFEFPQGFSAHWVRFASTANCTASALLTYE